MKRSNFQAQLRGILRGEAFHLGDGHDQTSHAGRAASEADQSGGWETVGESGHEFKDHGEHFSIIHQDGEGEHQQHHLSMIEKGGGQVHYSAHPSRELAKSQAEKVAERITAGQPTMYDNMPSMHD